MFTVELAGAEVELSNFPLVAGFYSQLAGVLAGFAFASLVALLAAQLTTGSRADYTLRSYRPLVSAFLGLVATSLNYAIIAGEERGTARLAALETTGGAGFCVAGTMLLYSIFVLLRGIERDATEPAPMGNRTADLIRTTLIVGICPLLIILMYGAARDHLFVKYGARGFHGLDLAALTLLCLTFVLAAVWIRYRTDRQSGQLVEFISRAAVAIAIISLLASSLTINFVGQETDHSDYESLIAIIVVSVFAWCVMYSVATYRPVRPIAAGAATPPGARAE